MISEPFMLITKTMTIFNNNQTVDLKSKSHVYAKTSIMLPESEIGNEVYNVLYNEKLVEYYINYINTHV